MNIYAKKGHRVKCITLTAGCSHEQHTAKQYLLINEEYTVDRTEVFGWSTDVYLQEFPGVPFNSVFFRDVHAQSIKDNREHSDFFKYNPTEVNDDRRDYGCWRNRTLALFRIAGLTQLGYLQGFIQNNDKNNKKMKTTKSRAEFAIALFVMAAIMALLGTLSSCADHPSSRSGHRESISIQTVKGAPLSIVYDDVQVLLTAEVFKKIGDSTMMFAPIMGTGKSEYYKKQLYRYSAQEAKYVIVKY